MSELFDLKKELHGTGVQNHNDKIITVLKKLVKYYTATNVSYQKINSINKAIISISNVPWLIISGSIPKIPLVGPGIARRIDEIITTGTLEELELDSANNNDNDRAITELCDIIGIGPVKAKQLVQLGITSIPLLIEAYEKGNIIVGKNMLTHSITIGIKYYYDLKQRIPREEIIGLHQKMLKVTPSQYSLKICGSFRRKMKTSGDIDVLVTHTEYLSDDDDHSMILHNLVDIFIDAGIVIDSLTFEGKTKFMGIATFSDFTEKGHGHEKGIGRRIDIRLISKEAKPFAILYFTGSGDFNKIMRSRALDLGYSLNEYFLIDNTTKEKIILASEKEIFDFLKCKYVKPEDR